MNRGTNMETNVFNQWIGGACGCSENISPCNTVFQKVDELPALGDATRNHGYILPDNTVWIVNTEGTGFTQLNGSGAGGAYDDTELRGLIQQALDRNTMEDNRLVNIENKNATQDQRLTALENKNTEYDSYFEEVSEAIGELQSQAGGVTYTAGNGISISADNVISATGGGNSYDDTTIKERLEVLEDCVIEEGGRQVVDITDQLKTYDEPLVVEDRTFDKYIDITFEGINALPGTEDIYLSEAIGILDFVVDKGDGSGPTPYFNSFLGDATLKANNVLFDPSKTTRISLDSQYFFNDSAGVMIYYDTAGGCLSERVEAIEAELRTKVEGVSALLDSKLTLKADNMPAQEAGLGDVYEVDFTNLSASLENKKLVLSVSNEIYEAIDSLDSSINELTQLNTSLQNEVSELRTELDSLKYETVTVDLLPEVVNSTIEVAGKTYNYYVEVILADYESFGPLTFEIEPDDITEIAIEDENGLITERMLGGGELYTHTITSQEGIAVYFEKNQLSRLALTYKVEK